MDKVWLWVGRVAADGFTSQTKYKVTAATAMKFNWTYTQTSIMSILGELNPYRFAYNGQERIDEKAGRANYYTFGEREYDPRRVTFDTPDPLWTKYPNVSQYSFAGLNPILNIDRKGLEKTIYTVIINEQTGKTLIQKSTAPGLIATRYTSFTSGITTYDWYDYSVANITTIGKDGSVATKTLEPSRGAFRTNTLVNSEGWAQRKLGERSFFSLSASKDRVLGAGGGWTLTTNNRLFKGNDHHLNRSGRGEFINVDEISAAFGVAGGASGAETPENIWQALKYARDAVLAANDAQGLALKEVDLTGNVDYCKDCRGYYEGVGEDQHAISKEKATGKIDTIDMYGHKKQ